MSEEKKYIVELEDCDTDSVVRGSRRKYELVDIVSIASETPLMLRIYDEGDLKAEFPYEQIQAVQIEHE